MSPRVSPNVSTVESAAPTVTSYAIYCEFATEAPSGAHEILKVADVDERLAITMLETTVCVEDGTVYKSVDVVALGALCPKILYVVGIFYPFLLNN